MFIAPNDSLFAQADAGVLADLDDRARAASSRASTQVAVDGSKVDGKFYMVPESLKAVALWYDKIGHRRPPPTTTDELLAGVKDGSIKLGLNQGVYHKFGWTGAFGGTLMDDTGKCIADQGGWADAYKYLADLKAAGAKFYTDGNALKQDFQTGKINAIVDGPWQTADFTQGARRQARRRADAGRHRRPGQPADRHRRLVHQPQQPEPRPRGRRSRSQMVGTASEQVFVDDAGHVPAAPGVTITDPDRPGLRRRGGRRPAAAAERPVRQLLGPFGDALNKVIDKGADPTTAIADACATMNEANGL